MRGPFLQGVLFAKKRSGWLHVIPTFYVVGANPVDSVIFQTMSLPIVGIDAAKRWRFPADTVLDSHMACDIISQMEEVSPLSFVDVLHDQAIDASLEISATKVAHWAPFLSLAFFQICSGDSSARNTLERARQKFLKYSRYGRGAPPLDFEQALLARIDQLEARSDVSDCIAICRAEAEEHAARLSLPPIDWPPEWPLIFPAGTAARKEGWLRRLLP